MTPGTGPGPANRAVCCLSYPDFEDWRAQTKSFQGMAFISGRPITFRDGAGGRTFDTFTAVLSNNAFGLLGVKPLMGRDFAPADELPGAPPVAILSYCFWQNRFGQRADIVGHTVQIRVMPEGFDFPEQQNFWMPLAQTAEMRQRRPGATWR